MAPLVRVQCFNVSADGYGSGLGQSLDRPFGHADPGRMFAWAGATASWVNRTDPGGTRGLDDYITRDMTHNIGAEIMGRNKFGPYDTTFHFLDASPAGRAGTGPHRRRRRLGRAHRWRSRHRPAIPRRRPHRHRARRRHAS